MTNFKDRQKSLFDHLKNAEDLYSFSKSNKVNADQDYGAVDRKTYRKVKHEMRQFRGKESIFKKPEANIQECLRAKTVPGYMKNPQKWVYYSLSDITPEQMSDRTNTATALALMQAMEEKHAVKTEMDIDVNHDDIVFKKPKFHVSSTIKTPKLEDETLTVKNNKIIMPEYVVGKTKIEKKNRIVRRKSQSNPEETTKKAELKLDHLYGDDDE